MSERYSNDTRRVT